MHTMNSAPLIVVLLAAAPAAAQSSFRTWTGFDASHFDQARMPYASTLADLDGDGDIDAAFVHNGSAKVTVIRNQGAGTYAQPEAYAIGNPSQCVIAADLDGDQRLDLIAADTGTNGEGNRVSVLRNTGTSFAAAVHYAAGVGPSGLAAADFNGDGRADIAVANYGFLGQGSTVSLLRNNGSGGLLAPVAYPAGTAPWKLAAGDLDGDGDQDLGVARGGRSVSVLLNQGGAFAAPQQFGPLLQGMNTDAYRQMALSDVDHDADLDVLYVNNSMWGATGPAIALLRNNGSASFGAAESIVLDVFSSSPTDLAMADVTGDGWPDALVAEHEAWSLVPGNGAGGFLAARPYRGGEGPIAIAAADVDGDGDLDPVVTNRDSLELTVHWNDEQGNLPVPPTYPAGSLGNSLAAGDVDHDGDLDVAVSYGTTGAGGILVLANQGQGTFAPAVNYPGPPAALGVKLRDLNNDGSLDLLWADFAPPYDFRTRLNLGNGSFGPVSTWFAHTCGSGDVEAFDVDEDGDLDVFLSEYLGCAGGAGTNRVFISRNRGDGTFDPPYVLATYLNTEIVGHGDLNLDGHEDLVLTSDGIEVYLGNGNGTFQPVKRFATDWGAKAMVVADLSGDGVLDVATYNFGDNPGSGGESMSVLKGLGNGSFAPKVDHYASYSPDLGNPNGLRAADVDADGDLDLVGGNYGSNDLSLYRNQGNGTFAPQVRFGTGMTTLDVWVADFTGDGIADAAALVGVPPSGLGSALALLEGSAPAKPTLFCTGAPNSTGAGAAIGYAGSSSIGANDLVLKVASAPAQKLGLFFYGNQQVPAIPFGNGVRCVGGTIVRLPAISTSAAGAAQQSFPYGSSQVNPGSTWGFQFWYRDPGAGGAGFNASNAISFEFVQ
jgi:hypothetical protein